MLATRTTARLRRVAALGGGLIGVAALAGCAPSATSGTTASGSSAGGSAPAAALKDGTYTATGHYQSPAGDSMIAVTVTLKSGTITAVQVIPKTQNPTAQQYESQFASGVGAVAVGRKIAGLQVGAVSGSSLTSQGFEQALAQIRADAG